MSDDKSDLIRYRFTKAEDALVQARALADIHQHSGAVNRAYYAMFYATMALLLSKDLGSSKHSGVIALFDREFVRPGEADKEWSRALHRAFKLRTRGDYEDLVTIGRQEAEGLMEVAETFLQWVRAWLCDRGFWEQSSDTADTR